MSLWTHINKREQFGLSLLVVAAAISGHAGAADLNLRLEGLNPGGMVQVAVFDSPDAWREAKGSGLDRDVGGAQRDDVCRRPGLRPGAYAVMAFHDQNSDGKLNTLPIGLPMEPYGFSNNARGTFGPPSWPKAAFQLSSGGADQTIDLR